MMHYNLVHRSRSALAFAALLATLLALLMQSVPARAEIACQANQTAR